MAEDGDRGFVGDALHGARVNAQRRASVPLLRAAANVLYGAALFTAGNEFPREQILRSVNNTMQHFNGDFMQPAMHTVTAQSFTGPLVLLAGGAVAEALHWRTVRRLRRG